MHPSATSETGLSSGDWGRRPVDPPDAASRPGSGPRCPSSRAIAPCGEAASGRTPSPPPHPEWGSVDLGGEGIAECEGVGHKTHGSFGHTRGVSFIWPLKFTIFIFSDLLLTILHAMHLVSNKVALNQAKITVFSYISYNYLHTYMPSISAKI